MTGHGKRENASVVAPVRVTAKPRARDTKGRSAARVTRRIRGSREGRCPSRGACPSEVSHNRFRKIYQIVNVRDLTRFPADAGVDENSLREVGLINKKGIPVKLLGDGTIDRALKISVHACTKRAKELVEKAGGEIRIVKK